VTFLQAKHFKAGRGGRQVRVLVIHDMEMPEAGTTAESCARMFSTTTREASAHYAVDADSVVQCVHDGDTAFAAPPCNQVGLHVEHAGYASQGARDWADAYSKAMLDRSAALVASKCAAYGIPARQLSNAQLRAVVEAKDFDPSQGGIVGHDQVSAVWHQSTHTDPGPHFPWRSYIADVAAHLHGSTPPPPEDDMAMTPAERSALITDIAKAVLSEPLVRNLNGKPGAQMVSLAQMVSDIENTQDTDHARIADLTAALAKVQAPSPVDEAALADRIVDALAVRMQS
jgi:N-acetyl-anhydromuramyl-L-alanine amidase AmpD